MANIVPFESGTLPAYMAGSGPVENILGSAGTNFPVLSIKGKVFTLNRGGEKTLITKPGTDGEPAASLEVIILGVGPKSGYARTFYANGYVEGSTEKPDCSSDDGLAPTADSKERQAVKCAICPQNAIGSGATQQNPKAKACKSSKLLAVAAAGHVNDPMLLKVPGASVVPLAEYGDFISKRGAYPHQVVTRISFDYTVAYPALTFKALGFVPPEIYPSVEEAKNSELVSQIIGERRAAAPDGEPAAPAAAPAADPAHGLPPSPAGGGASAEAHGHLDLRRWSTRRLPRAHQPPHHRPAGR